MIKKENLELIDVEMDGQKATLVFLDDSIPVVHRVNFNKQDYDAEKKKFVDSTEKAEKVETWCQEMFGCDFANLVSAIGVHKDVYVYDKYCSLFETNSAEKFTDDMEGEIYQTTIKEILDEDFFIKIRYDIGGKVYESKIRKGVFVKAINTWYKDPIEESKAYEKFEEKFGLEPSDEELIGLDIMVEVKSAFGKSLYGDIKKPKRK